VAEPEVTGGESVAEPTGTTVTGTEGQTEGQSATPAQTTNGTASGGESFFDYESIKGKPELESAYKEMQRAFSRKTEEVKGGRDKINQYDQFMQNPVDTMRQLARQYGYQMVQGQPGQDETKSFENWDDVLSAARDQVMGELQPMFGELQNMKKQGVEQMLDNNHPDWRTYEDAMLDNLKSHPTLADNPDLLYRMSVPGEVLEARAHKSALAKIQGTTQSGTLQGQSTTTQQPAKTLKVKSFNDAVAVAKQEMKRRGLSAPLE